MGIGVVGGAVSDSKTPTTTSVFVNRAIVYSGSVFSAAGRALSLMVRFRFRVTKGKLIGGTASCSVISSFSSEGITTLLISKGGFTSSMTTNY